ncbi:MAG: helix-turn-helix domain-containing protein, partial [Enterococcus sp.]|nr:helix-turn-helix domain-containing protein [Enterococcus sp.]
MLGMDKNTLLKLQIIEILDCLQTPITLKELQMKIGHSSLGTIRMNCKELQGIIYNLYFEDGYSLNLRMNNGRGIQLERSSTNLQSLITYLYKSDLAFVILQKVLAERKLSAIQFCMDQTISESTLRRKIKEINQELAHYHL